ncbi:MAG: hypothetical protein R2836_03775 [Chitinophagales bacterium]|nr:hypothetical protein [Bacteroidota bacterium]MCB9226489.1 hypothetical protein [Chitinophagales bacterium]
MNEQDYILIIQYFDDDLSAEQKQLFEKRLKEDTVFKNAFIEQKQMMKGINKYAKNNLSLELNDVYNKLSAEQQFNSYKPSKKGNGGFNFGSFFGLFSLIILLGGIISFFIVDESVLPQKKTIINKVKSFEQNFIEVDTVYREVVIPAGNGIEAGDTIYENELNGKTINEYILEKQTE